METTVKERLILYLRSKGIPRVIFSRTIGVSDTYIGSMRESIQPDKLKVITVRYPDLNIEWLLTGEGEMLKAKYKERDETANLIVKDQIVSYKKGNISTDNLIPFFDDVSSVGGISERVADTSIISTPTDYISTGDWFRDATAAMRHYGESMSEYPSGCILAIKEVSDIRLIIPGRDYVIETDEYRVTKKIQIGKDCLRAHSTNAEKYDDGTLIHQPFDIPFDLIRRIYLVLGYVVKKNGGTIVGSSR